MREHGKMGEWLIPEVCKTSALTRYTGSNPVLATRDYSSMGEHLFCNQEVLGSNPSSSTIPGSYNGSTPDSESGNEGPNPSPGTKLIGAGGHSCPGG